MHKKEARVLNLLDLDVWFNYNDNLTKKQYLALRTLLKFYKQSYDPEPKL